MTTKFYSLWQELLDKNSFTSDVVYFVPLVGYYCLRPSGVYRCNPTIEHRNGNRFMGTYWECDKSDLSQLDWSVEKATGLLIAIPRSGLYEENDRVVAEGNGMGQFYLVIGSGLTPRPGDGETARA